MCLGDFGAVVAAIVPCSSIERDRYCNISTCLRSRTFAIYSMTYWSQSLIPSNDTRIDGICVGVSRTAGETIFQEVSLLHIYMTEGVPKYCKVLRGEL